MEQRWAWGSHSLTQPRDVSMATRGTHPSLKWVYVSAIPQEMRKKTAWWALFVCDSSSKIKLWLPLACGKLEQGTQCGSQRLGDSSTDWLSCQITSEPWLSSWSVYSKPYFSPILLYLWPLQHVASKNICPRIPVASLLFFPLFVVVVFFLTVYNFLLLPFLFYYFSFLIKNSLCINS